MVDEFDEDVRLSFARWFVGEVAPEIAKARWRDDPIAAVNQRLGERQALIESAAGTMYHEQRRALTKVGVFQESDAGADRLTSGG
jgi:hypothetical protein